VEGVPRGNVGGMRTVEKPRGPPLNKSSMTREGWGGGGAQGGKKLRKKISRKDDFDAIKGALQ